MVVEKYRVGLWLNVLATIVYKALHPAKDTFSVRPILGCWKATNHTQEQTIHFEDLSDVFAITDHLGSKYQKYTMEGFVTVEPGDTVVDVGAFIGRFAKYAAVDGERVIALEPHPETAACLSKNVNPSTSVTILTVAAGNETKPMTMELSNDPTEHSVLSVDAEPTNERLSVQMVTIERLAALQDIDTIDFLKIDAEGFEPEVIDGIGDLPVRKIAVACTPERDGKPTVTAVCGRLEERGYETRVRNQFVFARRQY